MASDLEAMEKQLTFWQDHRAKSLAKVADADYAIKLIKHQIEEKKVSKATS